MIKKNIMKIVAISIVFLFLVSGFSVMVYGSPGSGNDRYIKYDHLTQNSKNYNTLNLLDNQTFKNTMAKVSYSLKISNSKYLGKYNGNITVLITFKLNNESALLNMLKNLSTPGNPAYHKYITKTMFEKRYSPDLALYNQSINYFKNFCVKIQTYTDRISISLSGSSTTFSRIFNVSFGSYLNGQNKFYSINQEPSVPNWMVPYISQISGLDNYYKPTINSASAHININQSKEQFFINSKSISSGYPSPINSSVVQYIYGSDLQVAYDEQTLFNFTYPTKEVVATILWSGQYTGTNTTTPYGKLINGTLLGPFDPADIYAYYNETLPAWEPHSKVLAAPLDGAPEPGPLASYDTSGAVGENTLDLEMIGSTAPGSTIFNVYGPNSSNENTDQAIAFILNPSSSYPQLNNVSVISNSWGSHEYNDTAWYEYLQEAEARGITVLASSGDSGDNANSSMYFGSNYANDWVEFPSAMAYNNFGVTAVGGTTLTLSSTLNIENQVAWYISQNDTENGGPAGSTGGISQVFPEPDWQYSSMANEVLNGLGRGVPDVAAIANNTIVYITIDGTSFYSGQYRFWGTSVSSSVEAGIVAEINAVLALNDQAPLGYLNPLLYQLGNDQLKPLTYTNNTGYEPTGTYNSSLPTLPFYNVNYGRNPIYDANYGYNLVTGWGSIDAYNFTIYVLNSNYSNFSGALDGVEDIFNLTALNVTSIEFNTSNTVNPFGNATIQQNFFIADSLGAPIYWIQNVILINGSQQSGWFMRYTGWVVYPFFPLYPNDTIYEYDYPAGKIISLPHEFIIRSWLTNLSTFNKQVINFQVNSQIIQLPVPGASYIIGSYYYDYQWQGQTYFNGPTTDIIPGGGLSPQFGIVVASESIGLFEKPTSVNLKMLIKPLDSDYYYEAHSYVYNKCMSQTAEKAQYLNYSFQNNSWVISINETNSLDQGIYTYQSEYFGKEMYNITFSLYPQIPSINQWSVCLNNQMWMTTLGSGNLTFHVLNGTYSYTIWINPSSIHSGPYKGVVVVNGSDFIITISLPVYTILFLESNLPNGNIWYINISDGQSYKSSIDEILVTEFNGTYSYTATPINKNFSSFYGTFTIKGQNISISLKFSTVVIYNISYIGAMNRQYIVIYGSGFGINPETVKSGDGSVDTVYSQISPSIAIWDHSQGWEAGASGASAGNTTNGIGIDIIYWNNNEIVLGGFGSSLGINPNSSSYIIAQGDQLQIYIYGPNDSGNSTFNIIVGPPKMTYLVIFSETGLNGYWTITINKFFYNSNYNKAYFAEFNGSYYYSINTSNKEYTPNLFSGNFTINGSDVNITTIFSLVTYLLIFKEIGLPAGISWYVNLSNGQSFSSVSNKVSFREPNGTYTYTTATTDKEYSASGGSLIVNGINVNILVQFILFTYSITFIETGIPSGTLWSVTLDGVVHNSTTNMIIYTEPNGSYTYTITSPIYGSAGIRYITTDISGAVTVNGANVNQNIPYTTQYYLTIESSPVNGGSISPSSGWYNAGSSVTIDAVAKSNYEFVSWTGTGTGSFSGTSTQATVTMNGPITEQANFNELFQVTFTENSLPPGTTWYVNLSNGQAYSSTTNTISFNEPNGTYSYTIATGNKDYSPTQYSGSFTVNGAPVSESITFNLVTYKITFTESGLSSGTTWYVTLNGTTKSSSNNTIIFNEPNGSYAYTIQGISGYRTTTYSGTITINGNPIDENITWSVILYPITIKENGMPNGTSWSATITGTAFNGQHINVTLSSTTNTITFNEPNGTYSYTLHLPPGYTTTNQKGNITVSGQSFLSSINAKQSSNYSIFIIIGLVVIIVAAIAAIMAMRRKK